MRSNRTPTDRSSNFEDRLKETMDSELEPEQVTPNTAGSEELPEYDEAFPLVNQFRQTNMRGRRGRGRQGNQSGRGKDQD